MAGTLCGQGKQLGTALRLKHPQSQGLAPAAGREGYQPLGLSADSVSSLLSLVSDLGLGPACCEGVSSGMRASRPGHGWGRCSACLNVAAVTFVPLVASPPSFWELPQATFLLTISHMLPATGSRAAWASRTSKVRGWVMSEGPASYTSPQ